ncbi:MAG: EVE domain-containing protein [Deltaproteobacteria bacterium]|nr:EVE domain-containing protein [Deltaproteobacteria bacterium]
MASYWLIKSEPTVYPWERLAKERRAVWDGVRNFEARNNLRAMKAGDLCLFYHSNEGKQIVGVAKVVREAYPDPSAEEGEDWSVVDVAPAYAFAEPVGLSTLKSRKVTSGMQLVTRSRLSVTKVTPAEWKAVHALAKQPPP